MVPLQNSLINMLERRPIEQCLSKVIELSMAKPKPGLCSVRSLWSSILRGSYFDTIVSTHLTYKAASECGKV